MNTFFIYLIRFSLGLILGAVAAIGGVVAPAVFLIIKNRYLAGEVMSEIFHRLNWITVGSIVIIVFSEIFRAPFIGGIKSLLKKNPSRTFLLILLIGFTAYIGFKITPELNSLRLSISHGAILPKKFGTLHRLSEVLYSINFLIAMVLMFLYRKET